MHVRHRPINALAMAGLAALGLLGSPCHAREDSTKPGPGAPTAPPGQGQGPSAPSKAPTPPATPGSGTASDGKPAAPTGIGTGSRNPAPSGASREELLRQREALRARGQDGAAAAGTAAPAGEGAPRPEVAARSQTPKEESLVLRFEPPMLDLGEMTAEVAKSGTVKFLNISDKPLKITALKAGCGCTTVKAPQDPIPAGGAVDIPITLRPGVRQGITLKKHVDVYLDGEPPVRLHLQGQVVEIITVEPEMLTPAMDDPSSGEVTLQSVDGTPFRILGASPAVVIDHDSDAKPKHVIHVDWAKWDQAGRPVKVALKTDHPKLATANVTIRRLAQPVSADDRETRQRAVTERDALERQARRHEREREPVPAGSAYNPPISAATSELIAAVRRASIEDVSAAIAKGARLEEAEPATGRTALHTAAKAGNAKAVEVLLAAGAKPDSPERTGKSALTLAAEAGAIEAMRALIKGGASVDHRDQIQGTPLLWAAGLGKAEAVRELLLAKADATVADVNGLTPLLWAAGIGEPASVQALLEAGADPSVRDRGEGDDALMRAARTGRTESVALLIARGARLDATNKSGATALHVAAGRGTLEKVRVLVEAKADLAAKDGAGRTALQVARDRTDPEGRAIAEYLETLKR